MTRVCPRCHAAEGDVHGTGCADFVGSVQPWQCVDHPEEPEVQPVPFVTWALPPGPQAEHVRFALEYRILRHEVINENDFANLGQVIDYEVTCARCGKIGLSSQFIVEEGDEWECPACWDRCEAQEREKRKSARSK